MNRTQKAAWINLAIGFFYFIVFAWFGIELFALRRFPGPIGRFWPFAGFVVILAATFISLHKKQSPQEVDRDERDDLITKRAFVASFVTMWVLLAGECLIPQLLIGTEGSIPVWALGLINVCIILTILLVYNIAVLIQYGRGSKDGN